MKEGLFTLLLIIILEHKAQVPDNNFTNPRPVSYTTAVTEDTLNNCVYLASYYPQGFHNEWQLHRADLSNNTSVMVIASGVGAGYKTQKMLLKNNILYLLHERSRITALDLNTLTYLWTCSVSDPNYERIYDFDIQGDTIFIAGDFAMINSNLRSSLAAINRISGAVLPWDPSFGGTRNFSTLKVIRCHSNRVYVGGKFNVLGRANLAGIDIASANIINWWPNPNDTIMDMEITSGKMLLGGYFTVIGSNQPRQHLALYLMSSLGLQPFAVPADNTVGQLEYYHGTSFVSGMFTQLGSAPRTNLGSVDAALNAVSAWDPSGQPANTSLLRSRNRLYVYSETNPYLKAYCLTPAGGNPITGPTSVCEGQDSVQYSIPSILYSVNYQWAYSGQGCNILSMGNNALLSFGPNATSGTLSLIPLSYCGSSGTPQTLNISVNQSPGVYAGADQTVSCYQPLITLSGFSSSSNIIFDWQGPQSCNMCQSFVTGIPGTYFLFVTDTISGCSSTDTCAVFADTIKPVPQPPSILPLITCSLPTVVLDGNAASNIILWWKNFPGNTLINDPASVNQSGYYYLFAQDTLNGCSDSTLIFLNENRDQPNSLLLSHQDIFPAAADTLTCTRDSIFLLGSSDTTAVFSWWKKIPSGQNYFNPFYADSPGLFRFYVSRTDNGCIDSSLIVKINQDTSLPLLFPINDIETLTCSIDTIVLSGQSLNNGTFISWSGPDNFISGNPALVNDTGTYIISVEKSSNGCITKDSVLVNFQPNIAINLGSDTIRCKGILTYIIPQVAGLFQNINYQWMDGSTNDTLELMLLSDSLVWVSIVDTSGCYGLDTLLVHPAPLIADTTLSFLSCDGSETAHFQIQVLEGSGPFQYAISDLWERSNQFGPLELGWHTYYIKDRLGCVAEDSILLSSSLDGPQLNYLISSINQPGDSLVIKDISNPGPDSILWEFPSQIIWLAGNGFEPLIYCQDTGTFTVTGLGYFNDCTDELTKTIQFGPQQQPDSIPDLISLTANPNPASSSTTVSFELPEPQHYLILLLDVNGIHLWGTSGYAPTFSSSLNLNSLSNGIYRLWLISEHGQKSMLLIKQP